MITGYTLKTNANNVFDESTLGRYFYADDLLEDAASAIKYLIDNADEEIELEDAVTKFYAIDDYNDKLTIDCEYADKFGRKDRIILLNVDGTKVLATREVNFND